MKKLLFILFIFPLVFSAQEKYERKFRKISNDFEVKIIGFGTGKSVDVGTTGGARTIFEKAKKGHKIIFMYFKVKNTTNENKLFDLRQFQVVDENSNVYDAYLCAGSGLNMRDCTDYEFKVKPNKRGKQARVYFQPEIPTNSKLKYLRVNGVDLIDLDII